MKCFSANLNEGIAVDITAWLQDVIAEYKQEGIVCVISDSATTALFISESNLATEDMAAEMKNNFPARCAYKERRVSPTHHAANIRAALTGKTLSLLCAEGKLILPNKQRVFAVNFEVSGTVGFTAIVK